MSPYVPCRVVVAITFAALSACCLFADPQPGWTWHSPRPQGNHLNDIQVIDANTVVAVGNIGTVIRSEDGAKPGRSRRPAW